MRRCIKVEKEYNMTIGRVGCNRVSFGNFYADRDSAYKLASVFEGKPDLELKFMQNIVEPLSHTKEYSVRVKNGTPLIINNKGEWVMRIISQGSEPGRILGTVYDYENAWRNAIRSHSHLQPTYIFRDVDGLLSEIESAKNIALDKEMMLAPHAAYTYEQIAKESLEQKCERLANKFKYEA